MRSLPEVRNEYMTLEIFQIYSLDVRKFFKINVNSFDFFLLSVVLCHFFCYTIFMGTTIHGRRLVLQSEGL